MKGPHSDEEDLDLAGRRRLDLSRAAHLVTNAQASVTHLAEVHGAAASFVLALAAERGAKLFVVEPTERAARERATDLLRLCPARRVVLLPTAEGTPYAHARPDLGLSRERAAALFSLARGEVEILVTSVDGYLTLAPTREALLEASVTLRRGEVLDLRQLGRSLDELGFERAAVVEDPGYFSVRGDLVDVWSVGSAAPVRIEMAFDRVDSITPFDPETQRSAGVRFEELAVGPAREGTVTPSRRSDVRARLRELTDAIHLPSSRAHTLIDDALGSHWLSFAPGLLPALSALAPLASLAPPDAILVFTNGSSAFTRGAALLAEAERGYESRRAEPFYPPDRYYLGAPALDASIEGRRVVVLESSSVVGSPTTGFERIARLPEHASRLGTRSQEELARRLEAVRTPGHAGAKELLGVLVPVLESELDGGSPVVIVARSDSQARRIVELLEHRQVPVEKSDAPLLEIVLGVSSGRVVVVPVELGAGFASLDHGPFVVTDEEIFGKKQRHAQKRATRALKNALSDLRSLSPGDLVVHRTHGVGRYSGLEQRKLESGPVELMVLEYQGGDRLYLPVHRLNQVEKLSGTDRAVPLDRLGGATFEKTKSDARRRVEGLADRLLALYADRKDARRPPLDSPGDEFQTFEAEFPHEETADQAAAIRDVIADLTGPEVMDRLVCGDVGFGKTEVAMRAAYLAVLGGRQVAVLCPTTVLAEQHLRTFRARLSGTGASVAALSRFTKKKDVDRALADLKRGNLDVVIGTHRLLSKDVHFKRLGLLVIDEEQRFGVTHKERISEIRRAVDVLTLSATPIPRTLGMAVSGLRNMSVIATAPAERRAIRTVSARFDPELIREAILRERARGGQIYYIQPLIEGIEERAAMLRALVPGLRVAALHGRMRETELERAMLGFVDGEVDVLVATSIVESGLDIPRANTMIVERADRFGLAQLYQLRGRVGRSRERAHCVLLVPADGTLAEEGRKRIEALERYTELGSGFQVATLDMELRGAGELLGAEQSGFIERVGFELFSEMLERATAERTGSKLVTEVDPEVTLDVDARLPETYVEDIGVRLSLYKRYASAASDEEITGLDEELEDRFGKPPAEAQCLSDVMRLRLRLRALRALALVGTARSVTLELSDDTPLAGPELIACVAREGSGLSLSPGGRLTRRARERERFSTGLDHARALLALLEPLTEATQSRADREPSPADRL